MNGKKSGWVFLTALVLSLGALTSAQAATAVQPFQVRLAAIRAVEIPAETARAISNLSPAQRQQQVSALMQAAIQKAPAMAPEIVGAVAKNSPDVAAITAAVVAEMQPKQAAAIARAAAAAAPARGVEIAVAIAKKLPTSFAHVAAAVLRVAPAHGDALLFAMSEAVPTLKPFLARAALIADIGSSPRRTFLYAEQLLDQTATSRGSSRDRMLSEGLPDGQEIQLSVFAVAESRQGDRDNRNVRSVPRRGGGGDSDDDDDRDRRRGKHRGHDSDDDDDDDGGSSDDDDGGSSDDDDGGSSDDDDGGGSDDDDDDDYSKP